MMNKIVLFIKNIFKNSFIILTIINSVLLTQLYAENSIDSKQKSLDEIDSEIISLEKKLKTEINSSESTEKKINDISNQLEKERIKISNNRYEKEEKEELLNSANFILDSLGQDLKKVEANKSDVKKVIDKLNVKKKEIDYTIKVLNDSINKVNKKILEKSKQLNKIKNDTKKLVIETISTEPPSEVEFILESENWDMFILNSSLYEFIIEKQKTAFNELVNDYESTKQIMI